MSQLKRYYESQTPYFITSVTDGRKQIFTDRLACELLLNILTYHKFSCCYHVYAFVIMPDHLHIIVEPHSEMNISQIVKRIKGAFARFYNQIKDSEGAVWQNGFYDRGIRGRTELNEVITYIHNNPLRKGLVKEVGEYHYSSYLFYEINDRRFEILLDPIE